jgi:hypothetical protein
MDGGCTESEPDVGFQNLQGLTPIMLLVRPHQHTSYANVAVAPQIMFRTSYLQQIVRIAVLWYEADCPATQKVGLYIYDVVSLYSVVFDKNGQRLKATPNFPVSGGWRMGPDGNWSPRAPQAVPFEYASAEHLPIGSNPPRTMKLKGRVSGKRVCGFDRGMGGLHSSLLRSGKPSEGSIRLLGDGRKKCMVWGANNSPIATGMRLTIVEFGNSWRRNEFWELSVSENEFSNSNNGCSGRSTDRQCACPYHDFGYLVAFPDPKSLQTPWPIRTAPVKRGSIFWPFPYAPSSADRPNAPPKPGQITAFRRYADVLAERKKQSDERRKRDMEQLKRHERALTEVLRDFEQNHLQGNQVIPPYTLCGIRGLRWKGLFRS